MDFDQRVRPQTQADSKQDKTGRLIGANGSPIPSVNRIFRLTSGLVAGLTVIVVAITVLLAGGALHRWEIETVNSVLIGANGPAELAVEYLDRTQAQKVTDGLLNATGIFSATLNDDFGEVLAHSERPPPPTSWVIDMLQGIWGESNLEMQRKIDVSSGRQGELSVKVMVGETAGNLIEPSLLAILLQAAMIIVLVSASIYWTTSLPLISGLRALSSWIRRAGKSDTVPLPSAENFRFAEIHDSARFIHSIIEDLLEQRHDLARTVTRLEEQISLNEQYIRIIQQILSVANRAALHISPTGDLTWYNRNAPILDCLSEVAAEKFGKDAQAFIDRLEAAEGVRSVTRRITRRMASGNDGQNLFDIDVELKDNRILHLIGIDLGDGGEALMISDETEARAFAQELFQRQKLESLGILASGIAHDMNNILAILSGTIELEQSRNPSPESKRSLDIAMAAVGQGRSVVRTLLTFLRKSRAEVSIENAAEILRDLQVLLKGRIGNEIRISSEIGVHDAYISVDRPRLTNALLNLVINARDAIDDKGPIRLTLREAGPDDDLPVGAARENFIVFTVEDDGPGIPENIRQRIMDPFFTTKPAEKGTGLGLTLAYNVAEEFGGKLSFRSEVGHGACFMIAVPRAPWDAVEAAEERGERPLVAPDQGRTVLLVDDEPDICEVGRTYLEGRGYRVTTATSVAQATLRLQADGPFDVVVTDLRLGDGSGVDIARLIRGGASGSRVILISGNMESERPNGTASLFDARLEKPFAWSELDLLIQNL